MYQHDSSVEPRTQDHDKELVPFSECTMEVLIGVLKGKNGLFMALGAHMMKRMLKLAPGT